MREAAANCLPPVRMSNIKETIAGGVERRCHSRKSLLRPRLFGKDGFDCEAEQLCNKPPLFACESVLQSAGERDVRDGDRAQAGNLKTLLPATERWRCKRRT